MASLKEHVQWGLEHTAFIASPDAAIAETIWTEKWGSEELDKAKEDIEKNGVESSYYQRFDTIRSLNRWANFVSGAVICAAPILLGWKVVKLIRKR